MMTEEQNQPDDDQDQPAPGESMVVPARDEAMAEEEGAPSGRPAFITELKSIEVQVGENVVQALRHQTAAAVLTFVQPSPEGGQRMVTIPVDLETLAQIQELLQEPPARQEVPCIGFHCVLNDEKHHPFLPDDAHDGSKGDGAKDEDNGHEKKDESS